MFATAPEYQGHGSGSALLSFLGKVADTDGVLSYLETAGNRNVSFYTKKGGYYVASKSELDTFKAEGGAVGMIRPCLPQARSSKQGVSMSQSINASPLKAS